ncbi:MAG: threonylcarbamoyl-AMP synthase [Candidatus Ryanbacteria bacterium RIFCSPHIGHO2_12_FULL_47_12b]|uniref:L-threonylcarbamoyladenylate synthase n=2 Tax=Candidatus Ryaniibacteriota TaxID=1817914 RepID=A0A1G2H6G0_9BACT|nr:MAG: Sua5/YciO/YrdC/YwlC family protein [Parcubacteria group bacterium GW2011_GWA2_47_10b]KKU85300.1 MAG: Sua5/YciO/YrdC/YwlC family protein [Parcubacteria group bacterium GW2011_GWA1_47_9]OGZ49733.1 MAG: threonylcarbamoyl-AMP synthase [Candidatus Ryanbacteria bacterium RIFCSPHIGHO2_02_FULL_47_25]OGZ53164.1 MAG: threonylcarbamoyl-AMP synthase [Candidatus Ryanbacteria bacterium RIFCSPHIGHO2_12_FULL_47_12b]OGZ55130.1 MAG: threonylcarbamoyl-AMP synthase [Candidatus Ryanbacteria bacterium RIFCSP
MVERLSIDHPEAISRACVVLGRGGIIIVPTDTVYGIGCDAVNGAAKEKIFHIKQRDQKKLIPFLVADISMAERIVKIDEKFKLALLRVWPGAFTGVFACQSGGASVGIRIPNYPWLVDLIKTFGSPLAVTSANISGGNAHTRIEDVMHDFRDSHGVDLIIDAGDLPDSITSTVVDFTIAPPRVLRDGVLGRAHLEEVFGEKIQ